mmetsp:Transcript_78503/g.188257  ORF Transcript_78503/g.188257 Transcript_78503/m.188257 type:complete len:247 (+) Transcript_78503:472-1212(+)
MCLRHCQPLANEHHLPRGAAASRQGDRGCLSESSASGSQSEAVSWPYTEPDVHGCAAISGSLALSAQALGISAADLPGQCHSSGAGGRQRLLRHPGACPGGANLPALRAAAQQVQIYPPHVPRSAGAHVRRVVGRHPLHQVLRLGTALPGPGLQEARGGAVLGAARVYSVRCFNDRYSAGTGICFRGNSHRLHSSGRCREPHGHAGLWHLGAAQRAALRHHGPRRDAGHDRGAVHLLASPQGLPEP